VRSDAAAIWATGRTWWQVPPVVRCEFKGRLYPGITGKDVIVALCGLFNQDQVLNAVIEFCGEGVRHLSVDDRLSISNMTTEWGALGGVFPVDEITLSWLHSRAQRLQEFRDKFGQFQNASTVPSLAMPEKDHHPRVYLQRLKDLESNLLVADEGAKYAKQLTMDLSTILDPQVAGPDSVKKSQPLSALYEQSIGIQKAYLVSCTNSRESDIRAAADVFKQYAERHGDAKVAEGVEFYVAAASSNVQADAEKTGSWQTLLEAGAKPLPPGCGPCIGNRSNKLSY
jgi:homoaconitate hydratase